MKWILILESTNFYVNHVIASRIYFETFVEPNSVAKSTGYYLAVHNYLDILHVLANFLIIDLVFINKSINYVFKEA